MTGARLLSEDPLQGERRKVSIGNRLCHKHGRVARDRPGPVVSNKTQRSRRPASRPGLHGPGRRSSGRWMMEPVHGANSRLIAAARPVAARSSASINCSSSACSSAGEGSSRVARRSPVGHEVLQPSPLLGGEETIGAQVAHDDQRVPLLIGELRSQRIQGLSGRAAHGLIASRHRSEGHPLRAGVLAEQRDSRHGTIARKSLFNPYREYSDRWQCNFLTCQEISRGGRDVADQGRIDFWRDESMHDL